MSDVGVGRVGRRNSADFVIASKTSPVLDILFRSGGGTVDDVLFLHSNLKHQAKHHIV